MRRRRYMQGSGEPPAIYNETDAKFYYRQTGGGAIIDNSPLVGRFDKIKGNTIAWNQLVKNFGDGTLLITNTDNSTTVVAGTYQNQFASFGRIDDMVYNHKYYVKLLGGCDEISIIYNQSGYYLKGNPLVLTYDTSQVSSQYINRGFSLRLNGTIAPNTKISFQTFDLTLIYGAGNEPSTPAQFEADYFKWFGKPLTYEPYDAGSLRSVKMSGIKSVGFNQWDEEWELGAYNLDTGEKKALNNVFRSKNRIKILPNTTYKFTNVGNTGNASQAIAIFYDSSGSFLVSAGYLLVNNKKFTTPENALYMVFYTVGVTYNNDVCINISDANKNGTYETHWSETRNIPITTLTGKVNGQGESVVVFPDGMLSAGNVHDEIYKQGGKTYAVKRVGRVDLGSLSWYLSTGVFLTTPGISDMKAVGTGSIRQYGIACAKYNIDTQNIGYAPYMTNKSILRSTYQSLGCVIIRDDDYSDAATFKTALNGVYLYYELDTPIVYELDSFTLPVSYNCAALGTEEILPENNSTPTSVAPIVDTSYRVGHVAEKPWYGIKWSEDNGQMQRIASNMELHATLPIQSKMKRCMLLDNGSVYKYISDANPFLYEDGTSVKYDGTDGQVMVEVPAYWYTAYKETDENNITWNYLKLYPKGGGQMYSRKIYRGAFEMITDNIDNSVAKGCSVSMLDFASMGTTKDTTSFVASTMKYLSAATSYRNWNYANVDATNVKNSLGKPTTGRNRATFRSIAARRGAGFSQEYWDSYNSLIRLYIVEYCNFDIQATINDSLTIEGFKQGGLGAGVTNAESAKWYLFNDYNSFVPCGVTVPLGNKSGAVSYAFTNYDFHNVNITYSVPSYRGIENPFGHVEKFIDGLNRKGKVDNSVTTEMIYVCDRVSKFAEDNADGYVLESDTAPRASGNFGGVNWNAKGTFWPKLGGRTMYSDYFYNAYANNTWYTLAGGSSADGGSNAGLFSLRAYSASSYANDGVGSRLLYTK